MPSGLENSAEISAQGLGDALGRGFRDLRISLTDRCDLSCVYCDDPFTHTTLPSARTPLPAVERIVRQVARLHERLGLETVRLTGGEPLLYGPLPELIGALKEIGIARVALTTNGTLLGKRLDELCSAGLDDMNVSLDAMGEQAFRKISRRKDVSRVIDSVRAAAARDLPLKLNCTVYRGINQDEILPLLDFARELGVIIRFLELMNMGHLYDGYRAHFFSESEILALISAGSAVTSLPREHSSTARYWRSQNGQVFGIIANHSAPFCKDCDRLRLDSRGRLYGCLSAPPSAAIDFDDEASAEDFDQVLRTAMRQKQTDHFSGSEQSMLSIGG